LLAKINSVEIIPKPDTIQFGEIEQGVLTITAPCFHQEGTKEGKISEALTKALTRGYGMQGGTNERDMLLDLLKMDARGAMFRNGVKKEEEGKEKGKEKEEEEEEEEKYSLPDSFDMLVIYGQRQERFRSNANTEEGYEDWLLWGLILYSPTGPLAPEKPLERVLTFSRFEISLEGSERIWAQGTKTVRII